MEEDLKKLETLVEALTHSGSNSLDEDLFKEFKKICRSSQSYIPFVYDLLLKHLHKKNSQIRLIAFQICKELFNRSRLFRDSVIKDLDEIINLTTEFGKEKKLPGPNSSVKCLKNLAISTLNVWKNDFGDIYKKLKIAVNYLEKCKRVNFNSLDVRSSGEQIVENEQQRRQRAINEEKIKKVLSEYQSNENDIKMMITSLSNCLSLLLPPVEDFFVPECNLEDLNSVQNDTSKSSDALVIKNLQENEEEENYISAQKNNLREFGVHADYNLILQVNPNEKIEIKRNEENNAVIENAKDCVRLINKRYLPMVKNWIKIYCKYNDRDMTSIKKIIDLKETLDNILKKYQLLMIDEKCNSPNDSDSDDDDDDDDFEEVKKEGYEDGVELMEEIEAMKNSFVFKEANKVTDLPAKTPKESELCEPGTSGQSTSGAQDRKNKLLTLAPKLPFDIDLYHWEDEDLKPPTLLSTKIDVDKFWGSSGSDDIHEIPNPDGLAALRTRVIEFSGTFKPVKWACRAPLKNGKLCPRKDRFKCPFHGKIVARDEMGNIQNEEDQKSSSAGVGENTTSDWQDPDLIKDIEAATGINLKMPEGKGKRRRKKDVNLTHKKMKTSAEALRILENKKLPGLIDVVKKQNNSYTRLSKKIFNRSSARRVASALNKIDRNKFRDKFGDQFNYF